MHKTSPLETVEIVLGWVLSVVVLFAPLVLQILGVLWWMKEESRRRAAT